MQSNGNESSPDGVRDGQASQAHAIQAQDAVRPTYQPRQRSPLSTQHRQAAYSELTGSSDDESGGIDYDTDDSALQDYMDNIAEQEQGNPGLGTAALAFAQGLRQPHIDQMYAYGSSSSSMDEEDQSTPPTRRVQPAAEHGAVDIPQRAPEHPHSPTRQTSTALFSTSAPVGVPGHRTAYEVAPLHQTAESPSGSRPKPPVIHEYTVGRSWSPTAGRGRRLSTGSLGASPSPTRLTSDDEELGKKADRAQHRKRIAPQSRFNRQRFDIDRAPSLDSKSARKTSWMRKAAIAADGGGGRSGPHAADGTSATGGQGGTTSGTPLPHMHASPRQASILDHPDLSQLTSKQRKKILQRERRAARAAQAGFDPVAIADDLLLFAESSYDGSQFEGGSGGGSHAAGTNHGDQLQYSGASDPPETVAMAHSPERALRMQTASPPFAGASMGSSSTLMINCGASPAGCTWAEKAAKVCGLGARIVGKRGKQAVEVWRGEERAVGGGRRPGGKAGGRRWTGGRKGVLDNEARSELDALVAEAVKEIQQGSAVDGIVTTFGVTRIDGGRGKASAGGAGASKKPRSEWKKGKLPFGKLFAKEMGYADTPVAFVSGGIIMEDTQRQHQSEAAKSAQHSKDATRVDGVADACMQEVHQNELAVEQDADACMNSMSSAPRDDQEQADLSQPPVAASPQPPLLLGFMTRTNIEHTAGAKLPSGVDGQGALLTSAFSGLGFKPEGQEGGAEDGAVVVPGTTGRTGTASVVVPPSSASAATVSEAADAPPAAAAAAAEPRPRPQPQSQLGQLRPLLESPQSSPDDASFMHLGLGFATADTDEPTTVEQLIPASTTDMDITDPQTDPQTALSAEPICPTVVAAAVLQDGGLNDPGVGEQGGGGLAEVPMFDIDMPVLGQSRPDRGAPQPKTRRELAITQLGPEVVVDRKFAQSFVVGHRPNDTAALAKKAQKKARKEARRAAQRGEGEAGPSSQRPQTNAPAENSFGTFERHTKGIGAKLLKSWGYQEGQGLGKTGQGIINPVQAHKWDKRAGIGNQ